MTIKACLKSMRLRTLPLSLSGSVMGIFAAASVTQISFWPAFTVLLTTVLLQILSNLSNELGDTLHGTDTEKREGIHYSLQDGEMTIAQMKRLIAFTVAACCISGLAMIAVCFGTLFAAQPLFFVVLGACAIWAAMHYTLGKDPYGYRGLGDIFVFIFFGLVSCLGACYICGHGACWQALLKSSILPACCVGCFSVGVLNVNNIRDMATDAATRTTVAIKLGRRRASIYQTILICLGWALMTARMILAATTVSSNHGGTPMLRWLFVLTLPLYAKHLHGVWTREGRDMDPLLPLLVISTLLFSILSGIGFLQ